MIPHAPPVSRSHAGRYDPDAPNVHALPPSMANFDECQARLKDIFNETTVSARVRSRRSNRSNWARVLAQGVYLLHRRGTSLGAPHRKVSFCVTHRKFRRYLSSASSPRRIRRYIAVYASHSHT